MSASDFPTHLRIYGGEQLMHGAHMKYRIFIQDPNNKRVYSMDIPQDTFERVMSLLGSCEEDAEYCIQCGSIKNARSVQSSSGGDGGYVYTCMCQVLGIERADG